MNDWEFEWDAANRRHIARHGVTDAEAEQAYLDPDAVTLEGSSMESMRRRTWQEQRVEEQRQHPEVFAAYDAFLRAVEEGHGADADRPMIRINEPGDIPRFASADEEQEFWGTHELGPRMLARGQRQEPRTRPVPIRFDSTTLARLRRLAERRSVGYQTLLREFVLERLHEEEIRDGVVTPVRGATRPSP